jgi:hypothetical protein
MINQTSIVDYIEDANDRQPFCECGRHTEPVYRDGVIWLECSSLRDEPTSRIGRLVRAITGPTHVHEPLVEAPAA